MQEFVDSSAIACDGEALRARLAVDGYLFFRQLLDPAAVEEVRRDALRVIAGEGWLRSGTDPFDAIPDEEERIEGQPGWWGGYRAIQSLESFHRLAHDRAIIEQLERVLGEPVVAHPSKIARVIWPQDPDLITAPHQDFTHIGGTVDFFTVWVPLSDVPRERGGLKILPGSGVDGIRSVSRAPGAGGLRSDDVADDDPRWATTDYRAGDAVVFHCLTVHAGQANTSGRLRLSVDYRYQPRSEPITTWSLAPHYFERLPQLASWDEFTAGWSTTRWIEAPEGMKVVDSPVFGPLRKMLPLNAGSRGGESRYVDSTAFMQQVRDDVDFKAPLPDRTR